MSKFYSLTLQKVIRQTADCVSLVFDVPTDLQNTFRFVQGQYLILRKVIANEDLRRSYSICTSPLDNSLAVAIKKVNGGKFSVYAQSLQAGDQVEVMPPTGNFYVPLSPESPPRAFVAFASGSGITPLLSIIKTTLQTEPNSQFTLFYGNRNTESIIFREELDNLKNQFMGRFALCHILSRESLGIPLFKGRITGEKCERFARVFFKPTEIAAFFLCGPETMISEVSQTLQTLGVEQKNIHFELFAPPTGKMTAKTPTQQPTIDQQTGKGFECQVTITIDGDTFDFKLLSDAENILDAAAAAGADLPYACKGGVCCTCKARLLEGKVTMSTNYALEPEEIAAGYVLTCQAHPQTNQVRITFDEN